MGRLVQELSLEVPISHKVKTILLGTPTDDEGANTDRVDGEWVSPDSGEVVATGPCYNLRTRMHLARLSFQTAEESSAQHFFLFYLSSPPCDRLEGTNLVPKNGSPSCFNNHPYHLVCPFFCSQIHIPPVTQPLWYASPIQIMYEVQEGFAKVHPWLSTTLVKVYPLVITCMTSDLKFASA